MNDEDIYQIKEDVAVNKEQIGALRNELQRQMGQIRALELKWYGVIAGLVGTIGVLAKLGGWL